MNWNFRNMRFRSFCFHSTGQGSSETAYYCSSFCTKALLALAFVLLGTLPSHAERLPIKNYTTADGLAHNIVNKIVRDSRGFLWFCTADGLSRFDGYAFTNYGTDQGLPHTSVNDILETREGDYWVATSGGLVHFNPKGAPSSRVVTAKEAPTEAPPMFVVVLPEDTDRRARYTTALLEGRDGRVWCGTYKGLYRLDASGSRLTLLPVDTGMPGDYLEQRFINDLVEDRYGSLWVATPAGLYRRWSDGAVARYTKHDGLPEDFLHDLLLDHQGQLWVSTRSSGFFRLTFDETRALPTVAFTLTPRDFPQSEWINQLFETSDHKMWAATARGLLEFIPEGDAEGRRYRVYTPRNGLNDHNITAVGEDAGGNLWLGSANGNGVMRLARNGFVSYGEQDGVVSVNAIFGDRAGGVCFRGFVLGDKRASIFEGGQVDPLSEANFVPRFGRFDGQRITWFMLDAFKGHDPGWVNEGVTLQAHSGEWWIANGLNHFPVADNFTQLKTARPPAYFGNAPVLGGRQVWRLFEDSHERIWISIIDSAGNGLALWERGSQGLRDLTETANLPSLHEDLARSFGEDRSGNVWIGFNTGLARARGEEFSLFSVKDGVPAGGIQAIYTDRAGRLWIASSRGGLARIDDPNAEHPVFTSYTTAEGLSSNSIDVITEDLEGHIYAGTGRGLDELDPATGRVKHFTTADGLAAGAFLSAFRDRNGTLWFGTSKGLSRFTPTIDDKPSPPPVILITGLRVAGSTHNVSALGESHIALPELRANQNEVQIDFVGLSFTPGDVLRYQYKLGEADWSRPTEQRVVNFANLSPHSYRFLVRAVNSDGAVSSEPAMVTFTIPPPLWLRWWFLTFAALAFAALAYAIYRYRVTRLLEVANMRTRIATDLHDDIGANLTRISILSEVAKQQFGNGDEDSPNPLTSIAEIARESVTSMSDIVWAIDPERDSLRDLRRKMRQHADEVFTLRDIDLEFNAPDSDKDLKLGVNVRRDLLLIFKEAVSNAARHSDCSRVVIDFSSDSRRLLLRVADNGTGFDSTSESAGHGLVSMGRRAQKLNGRFEIDSSAGRGTTVRVEIPVGRAHHTYLSE